MSSFSWKKIIDYSIINELIITATTSGKFFALSSKCKGNKGIFTFYRHLLSLHRLHDTCW